MRFEETGEDFMKEKEAQLKEKLLQNIQEINGVKVIKFCAAMIPPDTVRTSLSNYAEKSRKISSSLREPYLKANPMLTVMLSDNLVAGGLKAGNLVKEPPN